MALLEILKKSEFTKNVFILATGSSIAQFIPFVFEPFLSRIFTPAEFGVFEIYAAIVIILGSIASARYELAILLPKLENKAVNVLGLSLFIVIAFSLLIFITILVAKPQIISLIHNEELGKYLIYIPLGVFLIGVNRGFLYWSLRSKYLKNMSLSRIFESSGKAGTSIVFGIMKMSTFGLILGQIVGQVLSTAVLIFQFLKSDRNKFIFLSGKNFYNQAKIYVEFPKINIPIALTEMIQISGIIFIISFYFDNTVVGEFSKALRILLIPLNLLGTSISQVFYQKATKDYSKGIDISKNLKKIILSLTLWSLPVLILFTIISPWLFGVFLGKDWIISGEHARVLSIWIFLKFIISPVSIIPLIINKQRQYFIINLVGNLIMILSVAIPGIFITNIYLTLVILSATQSLFQIFMYYKIMSSYKLAHHSFN
jgi:O-antigen/teichoic acid export membrane protein